MSAPPREPGRAGRTRGRVALRRVPGVLLAIALLLFAASRGLDAIRARQATRQAFPRVEGRIAPSPAPSRTVEIARDARGTPHVEAADELDAWYGLGFAHAQDRLAQMTWLSRSARGRAAEWVGRPALAADRTARVLGIAAAAEREARRLEPETRRVLDAYAAGVNAWIGEIARGAAAPPLPLLAAGIAPETWMPADSLAIVKLWAFSLGGTIETSLWVSDLIEAFGGREAGRWLPDDASARDAERRPNATHALLSAPKQRPMLHEARVAGIDRAPARSPFAALRGAIGLDAAGIGSSAFVLSGRLSASGRPILAVDAHLETTAPAFLHEAHVRGGALDVAGATIPGVPAFWSGRNRAVAWAGVNAGAVTTDLFVESLDASGERVLDEAGATPLRVRRETIALRDGGADEIIVRESKRGPLIDPLLDREREPLAVAWTGAQPGNGVAALLRVARAANAAGIRSALVGHHEPVLAFVFADAAGAGGLQVAGAIPRRAEGTGQTPMPARDETLRWRGLLGSEALPQAALGVGVDWLVAADRTTDRAGAVHGEWQWGGGDRHARLEALLREATGEHPLELRDVVAMQSDVRSPLALRIANAALALLGETGDLGTEASEVARGLREWDGRVAADSVGAALYHAFVVRLLQDVASSRLGPDLAGRWLALPQARPAHVLERILARARDDRSEAAAHERAGLAESVRRSLRESWLWLSVHAGPTRERWTFGRLHTVRFRPLGPFARLDAAPAGLGPFPIGGAHETVSHAAYAWAAPFEVTAASVYRLAVDADQLDQALSSLAPGESEHLGHPHATDGIERWIDGRPRLLVASRLLVDETARARLELAPSGAQSGPR